MTGGAAKKNTTVPYYISSTFKLSTQNTFTCTDILFDLIFQHTCINSIIFKDTVISYILKQ